MSSMLSQGRYRAMLDEIERRHGDTLVRSLRARYGFNFLPVLRSIDDIRDVLVSIDEPSRAVLLRDYDTGGGLPAG